MGQYAETGIFCLQRSFQRGPSPAAGWAIGLASLEPGILMKSSILTAGVVSMILLIEAASAQPKHMLVYQI